MANSSLIQYTKLSPNHSGQRKNALCYITPHCVVGQVSIESLGAMFANSSRKASSNYGIDKTGKIGLFVDENNRSWCSSSSWNDNRAITIECASDPAAPYAMNGAVFESLVNLCTDICRRNKKDRLLWLEDKDTTKAYTPKDNEMLITVHRWFAAKSCPGDWLYSRLDELARRVTANLTPTKCPFLVKVAVNNVILYKGNSRASGSMGCIKKGIYTIIAIETDATGGRTGRKYGKLKSGAGYIELDKVTYL